jgi:DNA invertase Pin-like site-specific DNA recombinase
MLIGYARVSTDDQETALQIDALKAAGCERIFEEKASGARTDRPELARLLDAARKGDVVVVWKLDRLSRSLVHMIETAEMLHGRGVQMRSLTESIVDTTTPSGKMIFGIFAVISGPWRA